MLSRNIRIILLIVVALFPNSVFAITGDKANGLRIYSEKCWWCHGEKGRGDGPASIFLTPTPRDFTTGLFKYISSKPGTIPIATDEDIFRSISNGLSVTGMPSWKVELTEKERWDLVAGVKSFTDLFEFEPSPEPLDFGKQIEATVESEKRGREIFEKAKCYECHGMKGRGDGEKKLKDDSGARIWPRNLNKAWTFRGGSDPKDIFERVSNGIPGTPMPSFYKALTIEERWHVANYVKSINDPSHTPSENNIIRALYTSLKKPTIYDKEWEKATSTFLLFAPNLISGERFFTPLNDGVKVKAIFNDDDIFLLVEWADRTKSIPGDREIEELGIGTTYQDTLAVQFNTGIPEGNKKSYFGHGDADMQTDIWVWKSGTVKEPQTVLQIYGSGPEKLEYVSKDERKIYAEGMYSDGIWKVLFKRSLKNDSVSDIQFEQGGYLPIAFANWDGSNGENGSKHTFSSWSYIVLLKESKSKMLIFTLSTALIVFGLQYMLYLKIKE